MSSFYNRRGFFKTAVAGTSALGILQHANGMVEKKPAAQHMLEGIPAGGRVGIIGLDTSHSTAFVEELNAAQPDPAYGGYRIVAAFPQGSKTIKSSYERIPSYIEEVKKYGVEIVGSIDELLSKVDVVMLETNDGKPHLEQALKVFKSGKKVFIDKPVAASLSDVLSVYEAAQHYKVPVFSSSSLRYNEFVQETASGERVGKVLGADTFSPSPLEPSHPDFFWYGIHGIEMMFSLLGKGCTSVSRTYTENTDLVVGVWNDGRIGSFRGTRNGANEYGAIAFGEKGIQKIGPYSGYEALLKKIIQFFQTGIAPVTVEETIEIYAFMEAAHESRRKGGIAVSPRTVLDKAKKAIKRNW